MLTALDALIHPRPRAALFAALAADEPFVVHGLADSIVALTELPLLASREALLGAWPAAVVVHLPDVADEASAITATPPDAARLFACGMGLRFDALHEVVPALLPWLDALRRDLGLSALTVARCLAYATPAGKGNAPHFDQNLNFVLQLHGTKRWWLAANHHVERPLTRHVMGQPVDAELATYARPPMPSAMPADAELVVLEPGSMLVVPRGVWHATEAVTDALSLNFTYTPPTWLDLFSAALRSRLIVDPAWRQMGTPTSTAAFAALLAELAVDSLTWRAADVLAATEAGDAA
jgi:50S ribosomal protein L16 3-hydroxylase